ncbi:MAG: SMP-30/gluconolactonase/LRE family protein [Betaproteobacteria bacterium]|nr:SMP-30/gluconolactonase/LRE family protein [Betaproteobacteria bacterium]
MKKLVVVLALLNTACISAESPSLEKVTKLLTPESVVQATDGAIYVSEINEFDKDGDGQISVIRDGKVSTLVKGLDDPKGLAIIGDNLYIADKTKVLKVTLNESPTQLSTFVEASAFANPPQFLNDLEADPKGNLYVSDSGDIMGTGKGGAIYKIDAQGNTTLLVDGKQDERVMAPNGLLADDTGDYLIFVDFTSGILYQYNQSNKALTDISEANFGGGDGVVHHSNGTMYVSDWKSGKVYSMNMNGDVSLLKEGYQSAADIAITKDEQYLLVPDMKAGILDFIPLN